MCYLDSVEGGSLFLEFLSLVSLESEHSVVNAHLDVVLPDSREVSNHLKVLLVLENVHQRCKVRPWSDDLEVAA